MVVELDGGTIYLMSVCVVVVKKHLLLHFTGQALSTVHSWVTYLRVSGCSSVASLKVGFFIGYSISTPAPIDSCPYAVPR